MILPGVYKTFVDRWGANNRAGCWIISDLHFGEQDLKDAFPMRPSDEELIKRINQKVGKNGVLICLGDIGDTELAKQLKGYKILCCGNHDAGISNYEEVFQEIYQGALIIGEKLILSHEPIPGIKWAVNLHGHVHDPKAKSDKYHFNFCADRINYEPVNFIQWLKEGGHTKNIQTIHRATIDRATLNAHGRKRLNKKK